MLRKGFKVTVAGAEAQKLDDIKDDLRGLSLSKNYLEGLIWGRLYGGAALVLGIIDGRAPDQPVDENNIQRIEFVNVIDKRFLQPQERQGDPMSPGFGQPQTYMVTPRTSGVHTGASNAVVVHRSRMIIFPGVLTSEEEKERNNSWDFSVMETILPIIRDFQSNWIAVGHLVQEASVGVWKIKDLIGMLASGQQEALTKRLQMIDLGKSVARSVAIDAEQEEYTRIGAQMTELSSLLDRFMLRLSAATEIPVTILMGQSPAGMNATGDADFRQFYDQIATQQENQLKPLLTEFMRYLFLSREGPTGGQIPESWNIVFESLWALTPDEQANLEKTTADRDKVYIDSKVLLPEEVALNRFQVDGFNQDTQINREARQKSLDKQAEAVRSAKTQVVPLGLAPTDIAKVVTVNEARASQGLGEFAGEGGDLSITEFGEQGTTEASPPQAPPTALPGQPPPQIPPGSETSPDGQSGHDEEENQSGHQSGHEEDEKKDAQLAELREDFIEKRGDEFVILSKDRTKVLGRFKTRAEAEKRLRQIEHFKVRGK